MSVWAIGDLQGCLEPFERLLARIEFNPDRDRLLLAGDLVARGPDSLGTLRRVHAMRDNLITVLGNHDLHLLALAYGHARLKKKEERDLGPILEAPDRDELMEWLRQRPLLHEEPDFDAVLVHAGIPPQWTLDEARARAREVETVLQGEQLELYLAGMYGNDPPGWSDELEGVPRWRVITNALTRMRFVTEDGHLDMTVKGEADKAPPGCMPWFEHPRRMLRDHLILFGHWAALRGDVSAANLEALDSGCVWGNALTALRLEDRRRVCCACGDGGR